MSNSSEQYYNKRVLLLNPPTHKSRKFTRNADCAAESKGNYLWQPYDFLLLSGCFENSVEVVFIDAVAEQLTPENLWPKLNQKYDLIITSIIDALWDQDLEYFQLLKHKFPEIPTLVFGDAFIEDYNFEIIKNQAEGVILNPFVFNIDSNADWTKEYFQNNKDQLGLRNDSSFQKINKTTLKGRSLKPRHGLFQHKRYRWPFATFKTYTTITTNWGCPFSCSYCTGSSLPSLYRPYDELLEEMREINKMGIKEIYFSDKTFAIPLGNTIKMLEGMIKENFNFSWSVYFYPQMYQYELLEKMKASGCHTIIIGIESNKLDDLKKMDRVISSEKITKLIAHCNRLKINICGDFILGLPSDKIEDVKNIIDYSTSLEIDYASFNILTPLPRTSIKKMAIETNKMKIEDHNFDSSGLTNVIDSPHILAKDLIALRNLANFKFYCRPLYLLKRLRKLRGMEHFLIQFEEMLQMSIKAIFR